jgi:hypothetical protein
MKGRRRGGGWFGEDASGPGPFGNLKSMFSSATTAPPALAPTPLPGSTTADVTTFPNSTKKAAQSHCLSSTQTYAGTVYTTTCTLN